MVLLAAQGPEFLPVVLGVISVYFCSRGLLRKSVGAWMGMCVDGSQHQGMQEHMEPLCCLGGGVLQVQVFPRVKSVFHGSKSGP